MTTQELLKPRYKVIAPWFGMPVKVGDILTRHETIDDWAYRPEKDGGAYAMNGVTESQIENHPHLIIQIPWYSERDTNDLPKYVSTLSKSNYYKVHHIHNWKDWDGEFQIKDEDDDIVGANFRHFLPATLEDYTDYINSKK